MFLLSAEQKNTSHAGIFERSDCSDDQTAERKGSSRVQHGEEGQGCALGRKIVSQNEYVVACFQCISFLFDLEIIFLNTVTVNMFEN